MTWTEKKVESPRGEETRVVCGKGPYPYEGKEWRGEGVPTNQMCRG